MVNKCGNPKNRLKNTNREKRTQFHVVFLQTDPRRPVEVGGTSADPPPRRVPRNTCMSPYCRCCPSYNGNNGQRQFRTAAQQRHSMPLFLYHSMHCDRSLACGHWHLAMSVLWPVKSFSAHQKGTYRKAKIADVVSAHRNTSDAETLWQRLLR